jgi:CheY-like chemotaxis protein
MTLELLLGEIQEATVEIETALNGQLGVDAVLRNSQTPFHFILLDLQMPVLDGYGVRIINQD